MSGRNYAIQERNLNNGLTIWTIGHSTRGMEEFAEILHAHSIRLIADVRRFPASSKYPHFNGAELERNLSGENIRYRHFPALGGRRKARVDSHNTAWRNESFRGYADYMETEEFRAAVQELYAAARTTNTAFMCAEAVWWRCHRGLIADYLKANGATVFNILDKNKAEAHPWTSAARIIDGRLSYEGQMPLGM